MLILSQSISTHLCKRVDLLFTISDIAFTGTITLLYSPKYASLIKDRHYTAVFKGIGKICFCLANVL